MAHNNELGKQGEEFALKYLISQGYNILDTNWRCKKFEIDIVAQKYNFISFVEVKTRSSNFFGYPESFVDDAKIDKLKKAAALYLETNELDIGMRFEIIALTKKTDGGFELKHFEEAFY